MFCLIRHAEYLHETGALTPDGAEEVARLAEVLRAANPEWRGIRASDVTRTRETANILAQLLDLPMALDARIFMEGDLGELLPPGEPVDAIFITHLPVITRMLRIWSRYLGLEEPPMAEHASGYLVDPKRRLIQPISG